MDRNTPPRSGISTREVASREGGVDRNTSGPDLYRLPACRLPRGGRGSQPVTSIDGITYLESPPARGAWIATAWASLARDWTRVASREGGVDRNRDFRRETDASLRVASREGGVDRNDAEDGQSVTRRASPPARGAWIATSARSSPTISPHVASREGGVDRNLNSGNNGLKVVESPPARGAWIATRSRTRSPSQTRASPPARGAWIATLSARTRRRPACVASREGGVDRNSHDLEGPREAPASPPARGAWIATS